MKQLKTFTLLFSLCGAIALLSSCSKDDDNALPAAEEQTEYTLMLYGCGGGNLDQFMATNIQEALLVGGSKKVKMTGQIKFSKSFQDDPDFEGTRRFILEDKDKDGDLDDEKFGDASIALYDPNTLADFIRWSKEKCPAKNYILIIWNHGNGWFPSVDAPKTPQTRAVIFDDNLDESPGMSLNELVDGVKMSDTHLKMIYYDACLMNMLENLCSLSEIADYALGAAHITPGLGGDYTSLIENLNSASSLEVAMKQYCRETMNHWNIYKSENDIVLTDLSKLGPVTATLKKISLELVDSYDDYEEKFDEATNSCYKFNSDFPYFDIRDYVENLAATSSSAKLVKYATEFQRAVDNAIVCCERSGKLEAYAQKISWGVILINKNAWDYCDFDSVYENLAFDKATGWSKWLKANKQIPTGNPCPEDDDHEGDGDVDDEPNII